MTASDKVWSLGASLRSTLLSGILHESAGTPISRRSGDQISSPFPTSQSLRASRCGRWPDVERPIRVVGHENDPMNLLSAPPRINPTSVHESAKSTITPLSDSSSFSPRVIAPDKETSPKCRAITRIATCHCVPCRHAFNATCCGPFTYLPCGRTLGRP